MHWNPESIWDADMAKRLGISVHFNPDSSEHVLESSDYDGLCGVLAFPRNKLTTATWSLVTCKRCLNSKKAKQHAAHF